MQDATYYVTATTPLHKIKYLNISKYFFRYQNFSLTFSKYAEQHLPSLINILNVMNNTID
jgi:hypothetical protein